MNRSNRLALGMGLTAVALAAAAQTEPRKNYIVQLADAPAATYEGTVSGLPATKPASGRKLTINSESVQSYLRYLDSKQSAVVTTVPGAQVYYRYGAAFNGFAAKLTDAELQKLAANPDVVAITADEARPLNTSYTPTFLGINGPNGAWSKTDMRGRSIKGENVIIGHVDGGVWPEDPSFSDKVDGSGNPVPYYQQGTVVYDPLPAGRYTGICQTGEGFTANMCNNKLVGARFFNAGILASTTVQAATEYRSPRDDGGHGSHTLSTAGGNQNVTGTVSGTTITGISGIAPRARVAAYKSCYSPIGPGGVGRGQGTCFGSDSVAAINAAVADGVDVINFSVGGSQTSYLDAVETAFFNAMAAGVFVSTSAGNSGPANTVAHISPWLTTVGNSTHDRYTEAGVVLGNGTTYSGASFQTAGLSSRPLILSIDAGITPYASLTDADKLALARCYGPTDRADATLGGSAASVLDPAKIAGKIVVCMRGGNVLVNKAQEVKDRGGVAIVIQNLPASLLPAPLNVATANTTPLIAAVVPVVHLPAAAAAGVIGYTSGNASATAAFTAGVQVAGVVAPVMSDSSSRGPNRGDPNVLKPDITAPGTDIIAAYSPETITLAERNAIVAGTLTPQPAHGMISGTSMAAPHVAGAAALLRQANPLWSPSAIKSSLMTSAASVVKLANGTPDANPWGYGAGHLNPNGALATGLVYDITPAEYQAYRTGALSPWQLNLPSITRANIIGIASVTRTLKNLGSNTVTYTASGSVPGFDMSVSPASLTLGPGASAPYTATLTRTSVPLETWRFGELLWTGDGGKVVRSPVQAKASAFVGTAQVTDTRAVGSKTFTVATGWEGSMYATASGLVPATRNDGRVATGAQQCFPITVPAGALQMRVQMFNSETQGGSTSDLDLVVYRGTTLVGSSGSDSSDELVVLNNPIAGAYSACVDGYAPIGGSASFTVSSWVVGTPAGAQTLRAFGASRVYVGGTASVGLSWNVPAGPRYLGVVQYRQTVGGTPVGTSTVFVDTAAPPVAAFASAPVLRIKEAR